MSLLVVDGHNLLYRSYFGAGTEYVRAFMSTARRTLEATGADDWCVAWEGRGDSWRRRLLPEYKARRRNMPVEMAQGIPKLTEELRGVQIIQVSGLEADDVCAGLAVTEDRTWILSTDKDLCQIVKDGRCTLVGMDGAFTDEMGVIARLGVPADYVTDLLALMGDQVDNVPGVRGIGAEWAKRLVTEYGHLEEIFGANEAGRISGLSPAHTRVSNFLHAGRAAAFLCREVVRLDDRPIRRPERKSA